MQSDPFPFIGVMVRKRLTLFRHLSTSETYCVPNVAAFLEPPRIPVLLPLGPFNSLASRRSMVIL